MKKLILITSFMFLFITSTAFAGSEYDYNKLGLLKELEIMDIEEPASDSVVTRGEFAKIAVRTMGIKDVSAQNTNEYSDVTRYTDGAEEIYYLKNTGIMNGISGDMFGTNQELTQRQAVVVLTRILGWSAVEGDIETHAAKLRIGNMADTPITYGELVNCIYGAIKSDCVVNDYYSEDKKYEIRKNYLSEKLGVYEARGVVTGNRYTALDKAAPVGENIIKIGDAELNDSKFNIDDLLGYEVQYYYFKENWIYNDTDDALLVYACPTSNNKITVINDRDIDSFDGSTLKYSDSGRTKALKIKGDEDVIYNGVACPDYDLTMLAPKAGKITYIENNSMYNCIIIEEYKDYIVTSANDENIYVKNGSGIDLTKYDSDSLIICDENGIEKKPEDIPKGSVISVFCSKNHELIKIIYSVNTMTDVKISGMKKDENIIIIDSKEYDVYALYTDWKNKESSISKSTYKIYFDCFGKIARTERLSSELRFGYLVKISHDSDEDETILRIVPEDGLIENFECTDKVTVDSKRVAQGDLQSYVSVQQLICYNVDRDGRVNTIKTAVNKDTFSDSIADMEIDDFKISYRLTTSDTYRAAVKAFGAKVPVSDSTKVFFVAEDPKKESDDYYWSGTISYIGDDTLYRALSDNSALVTGYSTTNKMGDAEAVVIHKQSTFASVGTESYPAVVVNVTSSINDNDEERTRLTLLIQNRLIAYNLNPDCDTSSFTLSKGDIIRFAVNYRTFEIDSISMICDKTEDGLEFAYGKSNNYSNTTYVGGAVFRVVSGSVYDFDNNMLCLSRGDINGIDISNPQFEYYKNISSAPVYVVEDDKVRVGSAEDILTYKNSAKYQGAVICTRYSVIRTIVLYSK